MLPARPHTSRHAHPGVSIEPGTWWRLADEDHELNSQAWSEGIASPEHGLILLVEEVRIIDGEIHTVVLHGHPGWRSSTKPMLLAAEFFQAFVPSPDGEALRARELAVLMDRISLIGKSMSDIPEDDRLLEHEQSEPSKSSDTPSPEVPVDVARVPAALLPGGDIAATRDRLEGEILIMKLRQQWVEQRQEEMKAGWDKVTRYQHERAAASMAAISSRTKAISSALEKVHSMGLWLGDGIEITELVSGSSAPAEEPLHLMQRLLYLDEEIHTHAMLHTGFTADNMNNLGELLTRHPDLVERMLPHRRSVVITRIRRKSREMPFPNSWLEIFSQIEKKKADMLIQILVRDGDRVVMITADAETSNAERLFPSRAEIEAIFSERSRYNHETGKHEIRAITPHDIEYSDKRSKHDKRALFYRRFLLILWGAQEREQVFGPFLPAGTNWLEETVHSERFRFVHDEEEVLSDGRASVHEWIDAANAGIAQGSQVLIQTSRAADEESLPTAYKYDLILSKDFKTHHPQNEFELVTVARQGAVLIGKLPCLKGYHDDGPAVMKPLILRNAADRVIREGILCLDEISSADLRYYIASRGNRVSYLSWLGLFSQALGLVEEREAEERALAEAVLATRLVKPAHMDELRRACRAVLQSARNRGVTDLSVRKAARMVERLRAGPPRDMPDAELVTLNQHGSYRAYVRDPAIAATGLPIPLLLELDCGKAGKARIRKGSLTGESLAAPMGQIIVADRRDATAIATTWKRSPAGLTLEADWTDALKLANGEMDYRIRTFLEDWKHPPAHMIEHLFKKSIDHTFRNTTSPVETLDAQVVIGAVVSPKVEWRKTDLFSAYALVVSVDCSVAALKIGREDLIRDFAYKTYKNKPAGFENMVRMAGRETETLRLSAVRLSAGHTLHDELRVDMRADPHPVVKPRTVNISSRNNRESRQVALTSLEEILSWWGVGGSVTEDLGGPALEAIPNARRFIAPAAESFLRERGFLAAVA